MAVPLRFLSTEGVFLCGKRGHIQSVIRTWLIWEWGWKGKHSNFSAESENVWTLLSGEVADIDHESLEWRFRFLFFIPSVLCWLWIALTISQVHEVRPCRNGEGGRAVVYLMGSTTNNRWHLHLSHLFLFWAEQTGGRGEFQQSRWMINSAFLFSKKNYRDNLLKASDPTNQSPHPLGMLAVFPFTNRLFFLITPTFIQSFNDCFKVKET